MIGAQRDLLTRQTPSAPLAPAPVQSTPAVPRHPLLALQQNAGNQAVARLVQGRIAVGAASDPAEREADRLADLILGGGCATCTPDAKCAKCQAAQTAHRSPTSSGAGGDLSLPAPLISGLGPGRPLDRSLQSLFQPRLGVDLGAVRIHEGAAADLAARVINATAFTAGTDIAFATGRYSPESEAGRRLIGHELVHVAQQSTGAARVPAPIRRDGFDDPTGGRILQTAS